MPTPPTRRDGAVAGGALALGALVGALAGGGEGAPHVPIKCEPAPVVRHAVAESVLEAITVEEVEDVGTFVVVPRKWRDGVNAPARRWTPQTVANALRDSAVDCPGHHCPLLPEWIAAAEAIQLAGFAIPAPSTGD
tara:strand:- start:95 stop:502 length:408 start_codon:yes stop_codon:yes gene_type:complete